MKRTVLLILFLSLSTFTINVSGEGTTESQETLYQDALLTLISKDVANDIAGYYGEHRNFHLTSVKILELKRITDNAKDRPFEFELKIQVETWEEPTNKQGLETILMHVGSSGTLVLEYSHKDI
nr:DUF3888 domain-containing protein [Lysinibacillus timonensis]